MTGRAAWLSSRRAGHLVDGVVVPHRDGTPPRITPRPQTREAREAAEAATLATGATFAAGGGNRARPEDPDRNRTCFERDHDRIVHSAAFRRLAGKTQVFVFPADHQRTRLTHALEVAQVAVGICRPTGLNATLGEAIALGHDCGHGPGGHSAEDAFDAFLGHGVFDHAVWGADVALAPLNLCAETLDGIRNHSWGRPAPATPEGAVVAIADRTYLAHDLEDAISARIVTLDDVPSEVTAVLGRTRREQIARLVSATVATINETGLVGLPCDVADAVAALREFNYTEIYTRPASIEQGQRVVAVLRALVEHFVDHPTAIPDARPDGDPVRNAVTYVGGMTDRFAFESAVELLGWRRDRLPQGIDITTGKAPT